MFIIEYVIMRDKAVPAVIEKTALDVILLASATSTAMARLPALRQSRPQTGHYGYQIRDEHDKIILRSWDRGALMPEGPRGEKGPGDVARAKGLASEQRSEIARIASQARWKKR